MVRRRREAFEQAQIHKGHQVECELDPVVVLRNPCSWRKLTLSKSSAYFGRLECMYCTYCVHHPYIHTSIYADGGRSTEYSVRSMITHTQWRLHSHPCKRLHGIMHVLLYYGISSDIISPYSFGYLVSMTLQFAIALYACLRSRGLHPYVYGTGSLGLRFSITAPMLAVTNN